MEELNPRPSAPQPGSSPLTVTRQSGVTERSPSAPLLLHHLPSGWVLAQIGTGSRMTAAHVLNLTLDQKTHQRAGAHPGGQNHGDRLGLLSGLKIPEETKPAHHRAEQKGIQFRDPAPPGLASTATSPSPPPPHPSLSLLPHC